MTEEEPIAVTAEHVEEAARQLSPEYNYTAGYLDGYREAQKRWVRIFRILLLAVAVSAIVNIVSGILSWADILQKLGML